jgi:hypothetical protein
MLRYWEFNICKISLEDVFMKKVFVAVLLLAVLLIGAVSTSAASKEEVMTKLTGLWKLKETGGMYQQFNMVTPGYLRLNAGGAGFSFWLTIRGKGRFATKGPKWDVKVPAETGGDGTLYLTQSHIFVGGKWIPKAGGAAGPVEFKTDKLAKISFLDSAKYSIPDAGNDFISLTWEKIK